MEERESFRIGYIGEGGGRINVQTSLAKKEVVGLTLIIIRQKFEILIGWWWYG